MRIYKLTGDFKKYDVCGIDFDACRKERDIPNWDMMFHFDGSPQSTNWWPRIMERHNKRPKLGDYIDKLSGETIILEKKAVDKLKPIMGNIEILPLKCDFGDYWAINIMDVLECIDYEKSDFMLLSDELVDGRPHILRFNKYEFIKEKTEGKSIFKIVDTCKTEIFANDTFIENVNKQGITGFAFELVWQSPDVTELPEQNANAPKTKQRGLFKKQKTKKAIVTPLEDNVMQELRKMEQEAFELIGTNESNTPFEIVSSIYAHAERVLNPNNDQHCIEEINNTSILLAAAWGFAVCKEYKWKWSYLEVKGEIERSYYLLSPDHWYCCPPFYFITKILEGKNVGFNGKNDNTVLLLFNMIKNLVGKIPDEKYTVIS